MDIQYHKGSQSDPVLLGQFATDQRDDVIDLIVTLIQVVLKGLEKKNKVLFPDMIRIGMNKICCQSILFMHINVILSYIDIYPFI